MSTSDLWSRVAAVARDLCDFRGGPMSWNSRGRDGSDPLIIFSASASGNYMHALLDQADTATGSESEQAMDLLRRQDPSGITYGLLVREMVRATIEHSTVRLDRVLDEPGFLDGLRTAARLRAEIEHIIQAPAEELKARVTASIQAVNPDLQAPSDLELAVCMRDALHALDKGLNVLWLQCEPWAPCETPRAILHEDLQAFATLAEFASAMRSPDRLPGAFVARIGNSGTSIGVKLPGRIALLSTAKLNEQQGDMHDMPTNCGYRSGSFDLDKPSEHYPEWLVTAPRTGLSEPPRVDAGLRRMHDLASDCVLWLAMVVELHSRRMASTQRLDAPLCESLGNALGHTTTPSAQRLPATISPNWRASDLDLDRAFADLSLGPWEAKFLRPAIDGMRAEQFLPIGDKPVWMDIHTREITARDPYGFTQDTLVLIRCASPSLLGPRASVESLRKTMLMRNLAAFVLAWGRDRFHTQWKDYKQTIRDRLMSRALALCDLPWATRHGPDYRDYRGLHLFRQSPRHKTTRAMCVFNARKEPDATLELRPQNDVQIAEILGVGSTQDLPEFLRGWSLDQGWTTSDRFKANLSPFGIEHRWEFNERDGDSTSVTVTISVNDESLAQARADREASQCLQSDAQNDTQHTMR